MSTYDLYKQKMQKLAAIKNTIVRFRVLILSVLAAIIALVFTLLGLKGTFTQDLTLKANDLVYGDAIVFQTSAKAMMSNVYYEYAEDGSTEWSRKAPTRPGSYSVRAAAKGGFGRRYGKSVHFTIARRGAALSVADEVIVYGNDPTQIEAELLAGDTLVKSELRFVYADYAATETDVAIVPESVRIVSASGEDVTACYSFTFSDAAVRVAERAVTVAPKDFTAEYCGEEIVYEQGLAPATQAALGNGDTLTFETQVCYSSGLAFDAGKMPKNAGSYTVKILQDTVRVLHGTTDVTNQYAFDFADGTFTVLKREITITPTLASTDYDGEAHHYACGYDVVRGELLESDRGLLHTFSLRGYFTGTTLGGERVVNEPSVTEAGTYSITLAPVSIANYTVTDSGEGSFTLRPVELHVRTLDYSKTYDGAPLYGYLESYAEGKVLISGLLVSGHRFTALRSEATQITDVAQSGTPNKTPYRIFDSANADKTHNYKIVYDAHGTLTVIPAKVVLSPSMDTGSVDYDGIEHTYDGGYEIESGTVYSPLRLKAYFTGTTAGGATLTLATKAEYVVHAGEYALVFDESFVAENNPNYEISFVTGAFTVSKVSVVITTGSGRKPYDGTPLKAGDTGVTAPSPDRMLPDRHAIKIEEASIAYSFINVADTLSSTENNIHVCRIENGNQEDVSYNFDISYAYGTLTIEKRPVMLVPVVKGVGVESTFGGYTKVYDGTTPDFDYVALYALETDGQNGGAFVGGDESAYLPSFTVTSALGRSLPHVDTYTVCIDMPSDALFGNYVFSLESRTLTVTECVVTVYTANGGKIYDGTPIHALSAGVSAPTAVLPQGHTLEVDAGTLSDITHVLDTAPGNNVHACIVRSAAGEDVGYDFALTYVYGTLTILPRPVDITPDITISDGADISNLLIGNAVIYNGDVYENFGYTAVNLANGETLDNRCVAYVRGTSASGDTYTRGTFVTEAGDYIIFFDKAELESIFTDYTFTVHEAAFVVLQRELTITTADASFTYNGEAQYTYGFTLTSGTLASGMFASGHKIVVDLANVTTVTHVSDTKAGNNQTKFLVVGSAEDENNVRSEIHYNYKISYVCGTLTVSPLVVRIKPLDNCTKEYDGKPFAYPNTPHNFIDIDDMLLGGDGLTVSVYFTGELTGGKPIDADNYTILLNAPTAKAFTSGGISAFDDYAFDFSGTDTLVIAPRKLEICPKFPVKEYDGEAYDYFAQYGTDAGNFHGINDKLVEGDTITITAVTYYQPGHNNVTPIDAGEYTILILEWKGGGNFKAKNYNVWTAGSSLEITPRVVTVTPYMDSDTVEYSATEYSYGGKFTDDGKRILPKDDGMVLHGSFRFTFLDEEQTVESALHAGVYTIVLDDEQDYPNYEFADSGNGTFTITQRKILFIPELMDGEKGVVKKGNHYEKEYDGDGVVFADYETFDYQMRTEKGLLGDDALIVSSYEMLSTGFVFPFAATTYTVIPIYRTDENRVVLNDYDVRVVAVNLTITPRKVKLVPTISGGSDYTKVYDGDAPDFSYVAVHLDADGNPDGKPAFVLSDEEGYMPAFTAVGALGRLLPHVDEYAVTVDTPSEELCRNYAFTYGTAYLTITPRTVSIVPIAESKVYDGSAYVYPQYAGNFAYAPGSLPFVEYEAEAYVPLTITVSFSRAGSSAVPVHAGSYDVAITTYAGAIENAYDYEIDTSGSVLFTIEKRVVVIVVFVINADSRPMPDNEKVYDGKGVLYGFRSVLKDDEEEPGFVNDDEFNGGFVPSYSVTEQNGRSLPHAGKYTISLSYTLSPEVDADYEIAECRDCLFTILKREITVTPLLSDAEYDGAEHVYMGKYKIESGEVLDADMEMFEGALHATFTGTTLGDEIVNVAPFVTESGTYTLVLMPDPLIDYTVIDSTLGIFKITPRELHVRTLDCNKTYDSTPLYGIRESYDEAEVLISGELVRGHCFTAFEKDATYITDVLDSGMRNDTPYYIYDGDLDKTYNYTIVYDAHGYLFISPASVTLRPSMGASSVEYDGTAHIYDGGYEIVAGNVYKAGSALRLVAYFAGTTAGGVIISVYDYMDHVTDAGDYTLTFDENLARANNPNYTISFESGAFTVLKRAITVTTGSGSREYDGTPLKAGDASVTAPYPDRALADGHVIAIDESSIAYSFITVADTLNQSNNNVHACRIVGGEGKDVSYNYDIAYEYGTLTISKRNVCLTVTVSGEGVKYFPSHDTKEFDGTSPSFGYSAAHLTDGNPDSLAAFIGSDESDYAPEFSIVGRNDAKLPNFGVYTISISMPDEDLCENYAFTLKNRELIIQSRNITVITGTKSLAYKGMAQSWQEYTIADRPDGQSTLLPGHELRLETLFEAKDAGEYENANKYEVIGDGASGVWGNVNRSNYSIKYEYGTLTITQASIRIKPSLRASSETYGGDALKPVVDFEILSGELFGSDTLDLRTLYTGTLVSGASVTVYDGVTDAGFYTVGYDQAHADENNPNYKITIETVSFTVLQRSITLATASASREYDGTPLTAPDATVGGDGLGSGDALEAIEGTVTAVTDYTDTPVTNETKFVVVHGNRDVTHNYVVAYGAPGTLTIYRRNITIKPAGEEWEYDGKTHTTNSVYANGLADTDMFAAKVGTITKVGPRPNGDGEVNTTEYDIYRGSVCVNGNYNITYAEGGKLVIKPRKVTIRPDVESIVYDGEAHDYTFDETRDLSLGSFVEGDAEKLVLTYRMSGTAYNGTTVSNALSVTDAAVYTVRIDSCTLGDLDECYDVTLEDGTFEITRRVLAVRPADVEKPYDGTFTEVWHGEGEYAVVEYGDKLADGHTFRILGTTGGWKMSEGAKTKRGIQITAGAVLDSANRDVGYNYVVYTEYQDKFGYDLFKSDFYGKITVAQIEITVRPLAPKDENGSKIEYFFRGDSQEVLGFGSTDDDWNALFEVLGGSLLTGHRLEVDKEKTALRKVGTKTSWLVLKVIDESDGSVVTAGYKIVFDKNDDSSIEVKAAKLTITENADGSFTVSLDGKGVLTAEEDGTFELYSGHYLRINADGSYTVFRYDSSGEEAFVFEDQYYEIDLIRTLGGGENQ